MEFASVSGEELKYMPSYVLPKLQEFYKTRRQKNQANRTMAMKQKVTGNCIGIMTKGDLVFLKWKLHSTKIEHSLSGRRSRE